MIDAFCHIDCKLCWIDIVKLVAGNGDDGISQSGL